MTYTSVVSSKGQVTVPQEIRTRLGLREGDRLEFIIEGDRTIIRPARNLTNPFEAYIGVSTLFQVERPRSMPGSRNCARRRPAKGENLD